MHRLVAMLSFALAISASASVLPGTFEIEQVYSNADGTLQFVVIHDRGHSDCDAGENLWSGKQLSSSGPSPERTFVFPTDLPTCKTSGRRILIATQSFAALGTVSPDYVIPNVFLQIPNGSLYFASGSQLDYAPLPTDGINALYSDGTVRQNLATNLAGASVSVVPPASPSTVTVIEFHHGVQDIYFVTPIANEIALLDGGAAPFQGWSRTGYSFNVYVPTAAPAGSVPICRFFNATFLPKISHFYAGHGWGCETVVSNYPDWTLEDDRLFNTMVPDAAGTCPAATIPVYRLYNNFQGGAPNHRFVTSLSERQMMIDKGYIPEGNGIGITMCVPP